MRLPFPLALATGLLMPCLPGAAPGAEPGKPNIVFILADDLGYGDLGCYGATKVKTPNLDRFATEGMRFTDAHSPSAVCTPTRYALMTGQYAWRQKGTGILSGIAPLCIPKERLPHTLPALLKKAGYTTGVVGKWHLGLGETRTDYNQEIKLGPKEVGFDHSFIIPATGDRVPCVFVENGRVVGFDPKDPIELDYGVQRGEPRSFVSGIPRIGGMVGGKAALWKDDEIAATLEKQAARFLEANRERPFFLYLATHDIHVPRVPHARFRGRSQAGVRGDVIEEFDATVGSVLATLDRLKLRDNTLVIVTSDNGGVLDPNGPDKVNAGTPETNNGHAFNGPLRGTKGNPYEGGHRVAFLARWPGKVPAAKTSNELICHVDMLATAAALVGVELPAEAGPDTFSILPALLAVKPAKPCRDHLINHGSRLAIRKGAWKLIAPGGKMAGKDAQSHELYNLAEDIGETRNLSKQNPEKVKELADLLKQVREADRSRPAAR